MKHRRGIDLLASVSPAKFHVYRHSGSVYETIKNLREWEVLGARCGACGHIAWLDKAAVIRKAGNHYLHSVAGKLVCTCGNTVGNEVLIGTLGRN